MTIGRSGALAAVSGLLAGLAVVFSPGVAHAALCQNEPDLGDYHFVDHHNDLKVFHILSFREVFNVAQPVPFNNQNSAFTLNSTATATTSSTFTLSATSTITREQTRTAMEKGLTNKTTFSQSVTATHTTATGSGTTVNVAVPPYGRQRMDRGIDAIDVVYNLDSWEISEGRCWYQPHLSPHNVAVNVPTSSEGWRSVSWPIINQGGVVNSQTWSANDIRGDTIVAIFGQFHPLNDRVVVRQGANQYTIQAGSPWWYDSNHQINASLPGLPPGQAAVNVISRPADLREDVEDLQSNTVFINVNP